MNDVERDYLRYSLDQTIETLQDIRERLITEDYNEDYDITGMVATVNSFRWEVEAFLEEFSASADDAQDEAD
ncbi:MAG: hypothetical protein HYY96_01520 [Candidatus Tectomicrobia bacterium]|nr:hypothetical protein [Candidatus Tectomicrobia bacterium]